MRWKRSCSTNARWPKSSGSRWEDLTRRVATLVTKDVEDPDVGYDYLYDSDVRQQTHQQTRFADESFADSTCPRAHRQHHVPRMADARLPLFSGRLESPRSPWCDSAGCHAGRRHARNGWRDAGRWRWGAREELSCRRAGVGGSRRSGVGGGGCKKEALTWMAAGSPSKVMPTRSHKRSDSVVGTACRSSNCAQHTVYECRTPAFTPGTEIRKLEDVGGNTVRGAGPPPGAAQRSILYLYICEYASRRKRLHSKDVSVVTR